MIEDLQPDLPYAADVCPYPFLVVDAALAVYLEAALIGGYSPRWAQQTSGSSIHRVIDRDNHEVFHVLVRAMSVTETSLVFRIAPQYGRNDQQGRDIRQRFKQFLESDQANLKALRPQLGLVDPELRIPVGEALRPQPPRKRRGNPDNDWAREQLNAGKDYEEVYQEWARRTRRDPAEATTRDAFRKVSTRKLPDGRTHN